MSCFSSCFPFLRLASAKTTTRKLSGTSAVITGSSEGLGVTIAHRLAAEGVTKIMLAALGKDKLEEVAADIRQKHIGTTVLTMETDVSDLSACELLVDKVLEHFGCCDILVNNAGTGGVSAFAVSLRKIDACIDVNLKGTMYLAACVLPSMVQAGQGHIVNIGSISAKRLEPYNSIYMAAKCGVVAWSHALRAEMQFQKTGVTVHVVNPGIISDGGLAAKGPVQGSLMTDAMKSVGSTTRSEVADAVISAIKYDIPDIVVNSKDMKLQTQWPEYWQGPHVEYFKAVAEAC